MQLEWTLFCIHQLWNPLHKINFSWKIVFAVSDEVQGLSAERYLIRIMLQT